MSYFSDSFLDFWSRMFLNGQELGEILFYIKSNARRNILNGLEVQQTLVLGLVQTRVHTVYLLQIMQALQRLQIHLNVTQIDGLRVAVLSANGKKYGKQTIQIKRLSLESSRALVLLVLLYFLCGVFRLAVLIRRVVVEQLLVVFNRIVSGYVSAYEQKLHELGKLVAITTRRI